MTTPAAAGTSSKTPARQKNRSDKKDRDRIRNKFTFRQVANYYAVCELCHRRLALQYHHTDPTTRVGEISTLAGRPVGLLKLLLEMLKCRLVCQKCHTWLEHNCKQRISAALLANTALPRSQRRSSAVIIREINCIVWFERMSYWMQRNSPPLPPLPTLPSSPSPVPPSTRTSRAPRVP